MSNILTLNPRTVTFTREIETLDELYDAMRTHDYTHTMSDDPRVWKAGQGNLQRIQRAVDQLGYADLWQEFITWGWRTEDLDPPIKPEEHKDGQAP